jgi:hypothetical protein
MTGLLLQVVITQPTCRGSELWYVGSVERVVFLL